MSCLPPVLLKNRTLSYYHQRRAFYPPVQYDPVYIRVISYLLQPSSYSHNQTIRKQLFCQLSHQPRPKPKPTHQHPKINNNVPIPLLWKLHPLGKLFLLFLPLLLLRLFDSRQLTRQRDLDHQPPQLAFQPQNPLYTSSHYPRDPGYAYASAGWVLAKLL